LPQSRKVKPAQSTPYPFPMWQSTPVHSSLFTPSLCGRGLLDSDPARTAKSAKACTEQRERDAKAQTGVVSGEAQRRPERSRRVSRSAACRPEPTLPLSPFVPSWERTPVLDSDPTPRTHSAILSLYPFVPSWERTPVLDSNPTPRTPEPIPQSVFQSLAEGSSPSSAQSFSQSASEGVDQSVAHCVAQDSPQSVFRSFARSVQQSTVQGSR